MNASAPSKKSLVLIDATSVVVCLALVSASVWFGVLNPDGAKRRLAEAQAMGRDQLAELNRLQLEVENQNGLLSSQKRVADAQGTLPSRGQVDRALAGIAALLHENGLNLVEVVPQSRIEHPGLDEHRYKVTSMGSFPDYLRFLNAFEKADSWADITYLKLHGGGPSATAVFQGGEMTFSFFSIPPTGSSPAGPSAEPVR